MKALLAWLQQPSSVAGIAGMLGTVSAMMTHQVTPEHAIPLLLSSLIAIAIPDNSGSKPEPAPQR